MQNSSTELVVPSDGENRRAKLRLGLRDLAAFVDLPKDLRISHLYATNDPDAVTLVVEGDRLEPVIPECELPFLRGPFHSVVAIGPDGKQYRRIAWEFDSEAVSA